MTYWEPLKRKTLAALNAAQEIHKPNHKPWDEPKMSDKFNVVLTRKQIILLKVMIAHSKEENQ